MVEGVVVGVAGGGVGGVEGGGGLYLNTLSLTYTRSQSGGFKTGDGGGLLFLFLQGKA